MSETITKYITLEKYHKVPIVEKDDGKFVDCLEWCLKNCNGQFMDINMYNVRVWMFEDEKDALMFSIQWFGDTPR